MKSAKITLKFKKDNCTGCKKADKRSLKSGRPHCWNILADKVDIVDGACMQREE